MGRVPEGQLHHECRQTLCVHPLHVREITPSAHKKLHLIEQHAAGCKHGHPWTPENTYYRADNGTRQCRQCKLKQEHSRRLRRGDEVRAMDRARRATGACLDCGVPCDNRAKRCLSHAITQSWVTTRRRSD